MNRQERRRAGIKAKDPMISIKQSDIDRMKHEATTKAARAAFMLMLAIPTMIIHDKFSQIMKKDGREQKFVELCLDLYDTYEKGYVDVQELKQLLKKEAGVEID